MLATLASLCGPSVADPCAFPPRSFLLSQCKEHQAATKKLELWKTPDILVVHLKRFGGSRGLRDKIDNLIEFPVTDFDLSDRVQERQVAQRIELAGEPTEELGLESTEEPVIYDLCPSPPLFASRPCSSRVLTRDLLLPSRRRRRPALWRPRRRALHGRGQVGRRRQVVQL